ncbi:MAG: alpha amylase C-terminal domain-containing protein, partial [Methylovulum sp.]|nr:alpha amylase C-terminal domain-containing protein [Methylovulum sp.]
QHSIVSYRRKDGDDEILVILNFTPVVREHYRIGVPQPGLYTEILNSDSSYYDGSNIGNASVWAQPMPWMNLPHSIWLTLPPLGALVLKVTES